MTHNNPKLTPKIALYQPDIPQNTASIIRTCSCLGVKLEIIEPCGFTFHDKRFRRVVMDYLDEKMIKIYIFKFLKLQILQNPSLLSKDVFE